MNLLLIFCLVVTIGIVSGHQIPYFHQSYTGERVKTQHAIDSRQCYAICKRNSKCSSWSFFIKPEKCVLYSSVSSMKHKKGVVSGDLASATNLETTTGDKMICGEDLNTLHGLLFASSNTFVAHCCNNGNTTNNITCGNGVDCSSVCDVTPTCAKVVVEPEEGEGLCSTRDNTTRQNPYYAYGITTECNSQGQTSCQSDAYGQDTPPDPNFCEKDTEWVKKADWQDGAACCTCKTCSLCDCCTQPENILGLLKRIIPSLSSPLTSPSQSSSVDIDIDWKRGMSPTAICVSPGKIVQFNWDGDHNVEIIYPEDWESCNVTGIDNIRKPGPRNLGPAPKVGQRNSYFFTSGVADDCNNGMMASITVRNDCNAELKDGQCINSMIGDPPKSAAINPGPKNNIEYCKNHCKTNGFSIAAAQYRWCWCSNTVPPYETWVSASECKTCCPANWNEMCGFYPTRLSIYHTGV